jgi:hypothetical protein
VPAVTVGPILGGGAAAEYAVSAFSPFALFLSSTTNTASLSAGDPYAAVNASQVAVDGYGDVLAELPGNGLWRWKAGIGGAQQLTPVDAAFIGIAGNGNVVAAFQGAGVWRFEDATNWQQLTPVDASQVSIADTGDVLAELPGVGVWLWRDSYGGWQRLSATDANSVALGSALPPAY